jgi:hypothetical protein
MPSQKSTGRLNDGFTDASSRQGVTTTRGRIRTIDQIAGLHFGDDRFVRHEANQKAAEFRLISLFAFALLVPVRDIERFQSLGDHRR